MTWPVSASTRIADAALISGGRGIAAVGAAASCAWDAEHRISASAIWPSPRDERPFELVVRASIGGPPDRGARRAGVRLLYPLWHPETSQDGWVRSIRAGSRRSILPPELRPSNSLYSML